jgi:pyrroloquinoline quinone biosynthesis protein E
MAILNDPAATDPVCIKSPHHAALAAAAEDDGASQAREFIYRSAPA